MANDTKSEAFFKAKRESEIVLATAIRRYLRISADAAIPGDFPFWEIANGMASCYNKAIDSL